jgi:ubiquinone/menaquinone biosynthesis C-methylase UbiE
MNHIEYCRQFLNKNSLVLDVGSGSGKFLCALAKEGYKSFGVEIYSDYIHESEELAAREGVKINVIRSSAENLPFSDNYFDFINCSEVTEHVNDPMKVLREIFRVLKPSGKSYISFNNRFGIYDYHYHLYFINWIPRSWTEPILRILKKQKNESISGNQKLTTMYYYTFNNVVKKLENIGFTVKDIREEKIKAKFTHAAIFFLFLYRLFLRPFYFNSFHILMSVDQSKKND